jgi:hypothetical protein
VVANCTCLSVRFPVWLSDNSFASTNRLFNGVRSSCDMFAMNSDLYFDVCASNCALSARSVLDCCSSSCRVCSSPARRCDSASRVSVLDSTRIVFTVVPIISRNCSNRSRWTGVNDVIDASSITPSTWFSNSTGNRISVPGRLAPNPDTIAMCSAGAPLTTMDRLSTATCPISPSPNRKRTGASSRGR